MRALVAGLLVAAGVAGGGALGHWLKPPEPAEPQGAGTRAGEPADPVPETAPESGYVKLGRQLIVPVVEGGTTRALMVFDIALDVPAEHRDAVFEREPRIRDAFLRELFELSYSGAFLGTYISDRAMADLREKLLAAARLHLRGKVSDVLILDALRQEL